MSIEWITEPPLAEESQQLTEQPLAEEPPTEQPLNEKTLSQQFSENPPKEEKQKISETIPLDRLTLSETAETSKPKKEEKEEEEETFQPKVEKDDNGFVFYKCRFCGLTFNFMTTLKAHERVHDIDTPYLCNKCGESFHFMCELEYHAKTHLKQKGYKCDCGRTFYQYTDLLYHNHPGEDPEPTYPLPQPRAVSRPAIDPAEFPTPEFAEKGFEPKHPMRVYSDVRSKPYICQYCSKSYSDSRQLAYHMSGHRGERIFNPRASRYLMCRNENSYLSPGADVKPPFI